MFKSRINAERYIKNLSSTAIFFGLLFLSGKNVYASPNFNPDPGPGVEELSGRLDNLLLTESLKAATQMGGFFVSVNPKEIKDTQKLDDMLLYDGSIKPSAEGTVIVYHRSYSYGIPSIMQLDKMLDAKNAEIAQNYLLPEEPKTTISDDEVTWEIIDMYLD